PSPTAAGRASIEVRKSLAMRLKASAGWADVRPKTASASVLPETCGMPQSPRTMVTFCASRSHAAAFFSASTCAHETPRAAQIKVNSHNQARELGKSFDFISIFRFHFDLL